MRKSRRIPAYVHHRPSGQARVRINGKDHYLGKFGTPESHDKYDELIAQFIEAEPVKSKTLSAVLAAWWRECKRRYAKGKGKLGGAQNWRGIIRLLRTHYGEERADDLGPVKLRQLLEAEAERQDWSLKYTRMQLQRVRQIFKWAVANELVSVTAFQRLETVEIRHGRESKPLEAVRDELVNATLPHLNPVVRAMVELQRLTGMRPGEVVTMKPDEIDRSSDVWTYRPSNHKTAHHGKSRCIFIGPKAQQILATWLIKAGEYVFPASRQGGPYTVDSYRRAIHRACNRNNLQKWSPQQLRKLAATTIRKALDVESAASVLGHSSSVVTGDHYATLDERRAIEAVKKLG